MFVNAARLVAKNLHMNNAFDWLNVWVVDANFVCLFAIDHCLCHSSKSTAAVAQLIITGVWDER